MWNLRLAIDAAVIALIGTLFGSVGLKLVEKFMGRKKEEKDALVEEIRRLQERVEHLEREAAKWRDEATRWRDATWALQAEVQKLKSMIQ